MLKIGVSFDGFASFGESLDTAREAEAAGARSFWMAEHLGYRDPLTSCMAFALATRESTVVPTAISPFLRNPVPLAMSLATLAEAGLKLEKPLAANREYLGALRGLWSGEPVHAPEAMLHRLAGARMMFKPPQPIPVYLAPMKEQMLRFAGREADGVVLSAGLSAEYARVSLALVAAGARAADRDPAGVHAAAYIFFVASKDERDAMAKSRRKLAFVLRNRYIDDAVAHSGIPIDQEAIIAAIARRDLDAAAALVPEEAVEAFAVWGNRRRCAQRLQQYVDAGVREPVLFLTGEASDRPESLAVIAEFAPG